MLVSLGEVGWRGRADEWLCCFFFSSRRRHTRCSRDWSSDVCSSDLREQQLAGNPLSGERLSHGVRPRCACSNATPASVPICGCCRESTRTVACGDTCRSAGHAPSDLTRNRDRKSTRLNSSHGYISYAVFCLKKKKPR